eukprot:SAG25_NODE_840_length_5120_cov_3.796455_7_plen_145_part_00
MTLFSLILIRALSSLFCAVHYIRKNRYSCRRGLAGCIERSRASHAPGRPAVALRRAAGALGGVVEVDAVAPRGVGPPGVVEQRAGLGVQRSEVVLIQEVAHLAVPVREVDTARHQAGQHLHAVVPIGEPWGSGRARQNRWRSYS